MKTENGEMQIKPPTNKMCPNIFPTAFSSRNGASHLVHQRVLPICDQQGPALPNTGVKHQTKISM